MSECLDEPSEASEDTISVDELGKQLYKCADVLRGNVDKGEYKDYILPLVFYAEVNRRFYRKYKDHLHDAGYDEDGEIGKDLDEAIRDIASEDVVSGIRIPDGHSWESLRSAEDGIAEQIDDAFLEFERQNDAYSDVFEDSYANVSSFSDDDGDDILSEVISTIDSAIYRSEKEIPPDTMGEAYMNLVKQFAEAEAGEYFTPPKVTRLVVELLEPFEQGASIHDPTAGSGGMLVEAANQIEKRWRSGYYGESEEDTLTEFLIKNGFRVTGQELNPTITGIAKMNLALHGVEGEIRRGNSLTNPQFVKEDASELEQFDYILAIFPVSESGW